MPSMRIATYNLGGAKVAGRRSAEQQARSWHWLAANGIDLAFVQEAQDSVIPSWVEDRWTVVRGQLGELGKTGDWGSAIVARPSLQLQSRNDLVDADPWLSMLYDYVVVGEIRLPDGDPAIVASVHAVAKELSRFLAENVPQGADALFSEHDLQRIAQPTDVPWVLDVVFDALARTVEGQRFVIGGDWNNARLFDEGRTGEQTATMFFTRAEARGWTEAHKGPEERTWLRPDHRPLQLDHLFTDQVTAGAVGRCFAANTWPAEELSDHAPLVADLAWADTP